MFYRETILLAGLLVSLVLIALVLLIPMCYRGCWNKCKCCRLWCYSCNRCHTKIKKDEWVGTASTGGYGTAGAGGAGDGGTMGRYGSYFAPSIPAQVCVYLVIGFVFILICALTDVPFYVMWIFFFLVWAILYTDFLRRKHGKQVLKENAIVMPTRSNSGNKEKFDAYEAAGIQRNSFKAQTKQYLSACKHAIIANKLEFLLVLLAILIVTGITTIFSSCMCVTASPVTASSYLSRRFAHKYCKTGEICNVYFTLANQETDLIMNFHASEFPDLAYAAYDVVSHTRNASAPIEEWVDSYPFFSTATTYKMNTVRELTRYVNWADIANLTSSTTYYFVAVYTKDGVTIASSEYKIKTVPSTGTYSFITGGDMSTDADGDKLVKRAAALQPDFAVIGGDNAYDNGFKACYLRWDEWFHRWNDLMTKNEGGYTIPFILGIGNHEAGSFGASPGDDPYYTPYFPQHLHLQSVDPRLRLSYHSHRFGNTTLIMLDSDVVARMDGKQKVWLEEELATQSQLKIVVYHGNIYPSGKIPGNSMANNGKRHWVPLFDKYNVTIAFENHLHLYKRTKPLKNNKVDADGITYFGDGTMGVMPNIIPLSDSFYIEKVSRTQHFFHVTVQNNEDISVNAIDKSGSVFDSWDKHL